MKLFAFGLAFGFAWAEPTLTKIATVPDTQTLENLAIRHSGDILVTSVRSNVLHQISRNGSYSPIAVATIPEFTGLLGVAELSRDVFYIAAANLTGRSTTPGSNGIWKLDMTSFEATSDGTIVCPAEASLIQRIPTATTLNGVTPFSAVELLLADSGAGNVGKFNVESKEYEVVINETNMAPLSKGINVGVNGIHIHENTLYYTSLDQRIFAAIPISRRTGKATDQSEVIVSGIKYGDDFALAPDGKTAWIACNEEEDVLVEVDIVRRISTIVANSTLLRQSSAAVQVGSSIYVTGAESLGGNSTIGHLIRIDL